MKNFYLIANTEKEEALRLADLVADYLRGSDCVCVRWDEAECAECLRHPMDAERHHFNDKRAVPGDTECAIVIGGDGTILQATRDLAGRDIPLFGINSGHLGYLAQVSSKEEIHPALRKLIDDRFIVERRMMLKGTVWSKGKKVTEDTALNDVILHRTEMGVLRFAVYVNGNLFSKYAADGMIIATPTGSTAYNLSAGGPLVEPGARLLLMTPICPHTLNSRSIIFSGDKKITLISDRDYQIGHNVQFDGGTAVHLHPGDRIDIEPSGREMLLVQIDQASFLEKIKKTM